MKSRILRAALLATAMASMLAVFAAVPAEAAPSVSLRVYRCTSSDCSSKTQVYSGLVAGVLQIQATPSVSGLLPPNLSGVEIDVKPSSSSSAVCMLHITNPNSGSTYSTNWNSASYPNNAPSGCGTSSLYGTLSRNESVVITAKAVDTSGNQATSSSVSLSLNNAPTPPVWVSSPSVSGAAQRAPVVTLKWSASPEPDIQEYRFFRTDPSGSTKQYPVSAANPGAQGCSVSGTTYTCYDTNFPSTGFGGNYSYAIAAWRSSPSTADTCYFPNQQTPCIGAQSSDVRQVAITEPAQPTPTPTSGSGGGGGGGSGSVGGTGGGPGGGAGSVPSGVPSINTGNPQGQPRTNVLGQTVSPGDCFTCGTYKETLPYGQLPGDGSQSGTIPGSSPQRPVLAAGSGLDTGSSGPDPRQLWVSIAAGLVLLLTAGHVARVLRATAH